MPSTKNVYKQLGKRIYYREISEKFGVGSSTACTAATDEKLFRLVPMLRHGAQVLPLEPVPVPGHGAQIYPRAPTKGYVQTGAIPRAIPRAPTKGYVQTGAIPRAIPRAPTKGYVQTGARARARCPVTKSDQGQRLKT